MSKRLVAYFSASGVTAAAAKVLAEAACADLYEIKPEAPYTSADLNWNNKQSRSSVEMGDPASRPSIEDRDANVSAYVVIFVGFPIWWYVAPTIINTFLESYWFPKLRSLPCKIPFLYGILISSVLVLFLPTLKIPRKDVRL